jgi:hypothetical protein
MLRRAASLRLVGTDAGPLVAFAGIPQALREPERAKVIEDFARALERA